jgi:hypothetical protein
VSTSLALQRPAACWASTLIPPLAPPDPATPPTSTEPERAAAGRPRDERSRTGSGYSAEHGTCRRPSVLADRLTGGGLCAWIVEKLWAWTDHSGDLSQVLTADRVLDNITLYWLTGTGASSARLYWESIAQVTDPIVHHRHRRHHPPVPPDAAFLKKAPRPSRRQAQRRFTSIVYWNEPGRGGHFAAWEQPRPLHRRVAPSPELPPFKPLK